MLFYEDIPLMDLKSKKIQLNLPDLLIKLFSILSFQHTYFQCFDDVKAVLFVAALSGYDMTLFEDCTTVRIKVITQTYILIDRQTDRQIIRHTDRYKT